MLEPAIGNHDEEFLSKWYEKLKTFLLGLMSDNINFYDKTSTDLHLLNKNPFN